MFSIRKAVTGVGALAIGVLALAPTASAAAAATVAEKCGDWGRAGTRAQDLRVCVTVTGTTVSGRGQVRGRAAGERLRIRVVNVDGKYTVVDRPGDQVSVTDQPEGYYAVELYTADGRRLQRGPLADVLLG